MFKTPLNCTVTPGLQATIDASALAVPHVASLLVRTTGPGGSVSSATSNFVIGNPAPVLVTLGTLPVPLIAGNAGFTMTITGSGFLSGVSVLINGVPRPTTLLTPTTVQVTIPPDDLAVGAVLKVSAINGTPTIGPSRQERARRCGGQLPRSGIESDLAECSPAANAWREARQNSNCRQRFQAPS